MLCLTLKSKLGFVGVKLGRATFESDNVECLIPSESFCNLESFVMNVVSIFYGQGLLVLSLSPSTQIRISALGSGSGPLLETGPDLASLVFAQKSRFFIK